MSDKVVIEGVLCSWQSSDLHVGISINGPSLQGDWTPLSGRRVRVTVEAIEYEPRCPFCGGEIAFDVILATAFGQESRYTRAASNAAHTARAKQSRPRSTRWRNGSARARDAGGRRNIKVTGICGQIRMVDATGIG